MFNPAEAEHQLIHAEQFLAWAERAIERASRALPEPIATRAADMRVDLQHEIRRVDRLRADMAEYIETGGTVAA